MDDITRRGIDVVANLGDHASGPLWPSETLDLLMRQPWLQIAGNCDRQLVWQPADEHGASDRFAFERLTAPHRKWLASLPASAELEGIVLCHGTPTDDSTYLLEIVEAGRARLATSEEITRRLVGVCAEVVVCGHSHIPRVVRSADMLVVNPGSVGLPAYTSDDPEPHVMETGTPDARYAVLEKLSSGWRAVLIAVPYDHDAAAAQATRHERLDWSQGLRAGLVSL